MTFTETSKYRIVLAGCFLFASCFSAPNAHAEEQMDIETSPEQSKAASFLKNDVLLEAGYSYTHWFPEKISGAEMETQGLNLGWIELQSNTLSALRDLDVSIPRLRYEFSDIEDNSDDEVIYSQHETNEYYHYFVGMVQAFFPVAFRYETERFVSKMTSQSDLYYVPDSGDNYKKFQKGNTLYHETVFHDYSLLYKFKRDRHDMLKDADLFFGISYSEYQKPYNVDEELNRKLYEDVRTDYVFYSEFKGYGFLLEGITPLDVEGRRIDFSLKIGYGEIELTDKYKMSDLIRSYGDRHDYQNIVYFNPKITIGYRKTFSTFGAHRNIFLDGFISGDYRAFTVHDSDLGDINQDILLKAYVSIGMTF